MQVDQALAEFKAAKNELMNVGGIIGKAFDELARTYDQLSDCVMIEHAANVAYMDAVENERVAAAIVPEPNAEPVPVAEVPAEVPVVPATPAVEEPVAPATETPPAA